MQFDEILKAVGEFGPYQYWMYILISIPCIFVGMHGVNPSLILYIPYHRCKIPGYVNDTYEIQSSYHADVINRTIPLSDEEGYTYDECNVYEGTYLVNRTMVKCSDWVYDQTVFTSTFVTEQNIVCGDDVFEVANMQVISYIGDTVGAIIVGVFSDCIGRKKLLLVSIMLMLATTLSLSWAPNKAGFIALKFLSGLAGTGVYSIAFVLGLELVGPSKRVLAGMGVAFFYAIGLIALPGIGYWLRDWFYIQIFHSAPIALILLYAVFLPESPRWLISQGRNSEAKVVVQKIAKYNKTEHLLPSESEYEDNDDETPLETDRFLNLFKSRSLIQRSLIMFFNWFVVSMAYYGLSLNVDNLSGDFYLNFFLTGLVDFPAYTLCILLMDRVGRKKLYIASMVTGGVALICTIFTTLYADESLQPITLTLSLIGKLGVAAGYGIIYIWTAEIFPTGVRNSGVGACSMCANLGAILSPYIADLNMVISGTVGTVIPLVVFGTASLLGSLLTFVIPETLNEDLPETIEQAENVGQSKLAGSGKSKVTPKSVENTRL